MFGYVIENTLFQLDYREKVQEHYMLVKHYFGEPLLLNAAQCGSYAQLVDQPSTTLSFAIGFETHHQKPQLVGFTHIG
jgi:hypothetical protein